MKIPIETNQKFVFRLEDFIYLLFVIYLVPIGIMIYQFTWNKPFFLSIPTEIILSIIGISLIISCSLILIAYRNRLKNQYYLEDETIIKERNGTEIFRIPFKEIVSVRVNNKKGTQGTIIFFTDPRSKNFTFSFFNSTQLYNIPVAAYGFTKRKIDLVRNRKTLLTQIYKVNPDLHFIE